MTTQELGILHAQMCRESADPIRTLLSCAWISLALFYEDLARVKAIPPINTLSREQKIKYWKLTDGSRFKRIYQAQALYVYDLLNKAND